MSATATACYRAALAAARAGDLSQAASLADCALAIQPDHTNARRLLGLCLYQMGDPASAVPLLANPEPDGTKLVSAESEGTEPADAVRREAGEMRETLARDADKTRETLARAAALNRQGKWRKALRTTQPLRPTARILNIQGCLYAAAKRYPAASTCFARALAADTGNPDAARYLRAISERLPHKPTLWSLLRGIH